MLCHKLHVTHFSAQLCCALQETSNDLDKQAEDAYNLLMAVRSPEPQPETANSTAQQQEPEQQEEAESEEQLFAVYLQNAPGSASSSKQFVQLLRLPEQAWQHDYALQRGMLVVPLQGAGQQQDDGSHAVSAEELAWQEQQEHLYEQEQEQQDIFFGWTPLGMDVSTISSDSGDSTDASCDGSDSSEDSDTESSSDSDSDGSCVSRIKVCTCQGAWGVAGVCNLIGGLALSGILTLQGDLQCKWPLPTRFLHVSGTGLCK